ncbi:hypothetical protein [Halomonas denitrificans]|uniref:hypothetical protein n=1 Tax=Halomonas denitrificans TaxID=370769 RepID=UPI000D388152|nr:hypothetical protein [Halomonas denitrificans]
MSKETYQQSRDKVDEFLHEPTSQDTQKVQTLLQIIETQDQRIEDMQPVYDKATNAIELAGHLYEKALCGDEEAWERYKGLLSALLLLGLCHEDDRAQLSMTLR